jgi:two-component system sensor histidine kinase FlrB
LLVGLRHLDHMVNDMLVFARGGQGGDDLVTVNALLIQVKASLLPRLESVKADWHVACDDLAISVKGHGEVLASVLANLASNALDACTDHPSLNWQVAVRNDSVLIALQDNGPGIDTNLQDQIFEPFFTTRTSGTGLGLAVVRAVIVAHQGEIKLDAGYRDGARFVIRLPVCRAQQHLPSEMLQNQQKAIAASSRYV